MAGIDQYTKLMLHCNGTDGSTSFPDDSEYIHTVTANGDAQVDTAQSKFGGASGLFDGTGDYLSILDSDDWDFGSGDFTIDFWIRRNGSQASYAGVIGTEKDLGNNGWIIRFDIGLNLHKILFGFYQSGWVTVQSNTELSDLIWTHIAVVRNGNTVYLFQGGTQVGSVDVTGKAVNDASNGLVIGRLDTTINNYYFNGHLDEIRISKGIARWTSNFTPPTEEYTKDKTLDIEETVILNDEWQIKINPEQQNIEETIILDDSWLIQSNPEQEQIDEIITLDDNWNILILEDSYFASKIISYNPLIYVTNSNPAKIIKVDITDPVNPIKYTYKIISNSYAKDIVYNSTNDYFYVICANGKIIKINKNDLEDQTTIDTLDTDILLNIDAIDSSFLTFSSTDDFNGEIIMLDEREIKKLSCDIRWSQQIIKIISTQVNWILGKLINLDLRWKAITSKIVSLDLRWLKSSYDDIFKFPISYTDWEVYINGTELIVIDDVDTNSLLITHDITQEEEKASQAQFILNRRHDKLNYTKTGVASEITNNNIVIVKIKGVTEFTGKISNLTCNSETETVNVIAIGTRPSDKRHTVPIPMPSLNEQLHLYHCLISNINIDNPYIDSNDKNPEYYKGIFVNLGSKIEQNFLRYSAIIDITTLAGEIEEGNFTPKQNWTYFWFAKFTHFILGLTQGTLRYLGTSLGSLSTDAWKINGASYKYQKELEDTEILLGDGTVIASDFDEISGIEGSIVINKLISGGYINSYGTILNKFKIITNLKDFNIQYDGKEASIYEIIKNKLGYYVGSAPYNEISVKNGEKITKDKWVDKSDGLYLIKEESYNYTQYAKRVADLEYQKLLNINNQILPKTSAEINLSIDAYYYYNIGLLTRINITNTTTSNIYNQNNGFPVSVKNIKIQCAIEGENSMIVTLSCDNSKSQLELEEIDAQYPDEESDEFVFEEKSDRVYQKFDPNSWGYID